MIIQQGDILIEAAGVPAGAKPVTRRDGRIILADGESTGHAHAVVADTAVAYEADGTLYLSVDADTDVVHEEHGTVTLPPGEYRVRHVREFDHFAEEARDVQD